MRRFKQLYSEKPVTIELYDKDQVNELAGITSNDTVLVSYYIRPNVNGAPHIKQEISKTKNIKSKLTRDNVRESLNKILLAAQQSEMGQALFSDGNRVWQVNTSKPINISYYLCEKYFYLDYFHDMQQSGARILLVYLGSPFSFYIYHCGNIEPCLQLDNKIPKKHNKGGQSSSRFEGIRQSEIHKARNIIMSHISTIKHDKLVFTGSNYLYNAMKINKDYIFRHAQYNSMNELNNIVSEFDDTLQWERNIISALFEMLATHYDKIDYGENNCLQHIRNNNIEYLIVDNEHKYICHLLHEELPRIILTGNTEQHEMFRNMGGAFILLKYVDIIELDVSSDSIEVFY